MNLVIFDLDGTLTRSSKIDLACFSMTIKKTLNIATVNTNLEEYEHATASFIYRDLYHRQHRRKPGPQELEAAQKMMLALLKHALGVNASYVVPVPGADRILKLMGQHGQWQVAIATGSWRLPAAHKLAHAGLDTTGVPMAFADDALSREGIVGRARERAQAAAQVVSFDRIVCVGDGLWDLQTARNLGYGFVGITCDVDPMRLRRAGARVLLPDFSNPQAFLKALEMAADLAEEDSVSRR